MFFFNRLMYLILAVTYVAMASPLEAATADLDSSFSDDDGNRTGVWAQFCDDEACTRGCGPSLSIYNPLCWNEHDRKSIKFHGAGSRFNALVVSPDSGCPCQATCAKLPRYGKCWDISDYSDALSFRFIGGGCDSDNC
jgi:hypothetical protein